MKVKVNMVSVLLLSIAGYGVADDLSPLNSLQNPYVIENGSYEIIDPEVVAGRLLAEQALVTGDSINSGENKLVLQPLSFTNEDLRAGRYVLDEQEVYSLRSMVDTNDAVNVSLDVDNPFIAMDCAATAEQIAIEADGKVNKVACNGNESEKRLTTSHQYKSPSYAYNVPYSEQVQVGTKRVKVGERCTDWFIIKEWCLNYVNVYETVPVYEEQVTEHYDRKRYTNWDLTISGTTGTSLATGQYREQRSFFNIEKGWVPVDVAGITTFVKADVKKVYRVELENLEAPMSQYVAFNSGRRFIVQCGSHTFFDEEDYFTSSGSSQKLDGQFGAQCANEKIVFRFQNMRDVDGHLTTVNFKPENSVLDAATYIGNYAVNLKSRLYDAKADYQFYKNIYNPLSTGEPSSSPVISNYQDTASEYSNGLRILMTEFAEQSEEVSQSDVDSLYFSSSTQVASWVDTGAMIVSQPVEQLNFMYQGSGIYIGAVIESEPEWFGEFESWFYDPNKGNRAGSEISPEFSVEAIRNAMLYAVNPDGLDVHYAFGCKYLESWKQLTRAKVTADRFIYMMNSYRPGSAYPTTPAYTTDQEIALFNDHFNEVNGTLNSLETGIGPIPEWSKAAQDTMCIVASNGGASD